MFKFDNNKREVAPTSAPLFIFGIYKITKKISNHQNTRSFLCIFMTLRAALQSFVGKDFLSSSCQLLPGFMDAAGALVDAFLADSRPFSVNLIKSGRSLAEIVYICMREWAIQKQQRLWQS